MTEAVIDKKMMNFQFLTILVVMMTAVWKVVNRVVVVVKYFQFEMQTMALASILALKSLTHFVNKNEDAQFYVNTFFARLCAQSFCRPNSYD